MSLRHITFFTIFSLFLLGCTRTDTSDGQIDPPKPQIKNTVFLTGDSTCAPYSDSDRPKYGWGEKFGEYVQGCKVENKAVGGKSTKTFISGGQWAKLLKSVGKGDVVLIQFGHNDENTTASDNRGTTPEEYYNNLCKMITDVQSKSATAVILTPICRLSYTDGIPNYTHKTYPEYAKKAAADHSVILLDIEQSTYEWLGRLGEEAARLRFMISVEGSNDTTHLTEMGAIEIAEIVAKAMKNCNNPKLADLVKHKTY